MAWIGGGVVLVGLIAKAFGVFGAANIPASSQVPVPPVPNPKATGVMNNGELLPSWIDQGDGSQFAQTLVLQIGPIVTDIDGALKLLLHESGLEPFADNGKYAGINQIDHADIAGLTGGMSVTSFKGLTAEQQLPYAAEFWTMVSKEFSLGLPLNPRDLYWLNFLPATVVPGADDSYVFVRSGANGDREGDVYITPDGQEHSYPGVYADNPSLHQGYGASGTITAGDMRLALGAGAREHPHLYPYFSNLIGIGTA